MQAQALTGGFPDAPRDAARAFRATMEALARPGTITTLTGATPPAPLSPAAGALLLVLADGSTPVHLAGRHDCAALRDWITFHTGAPLVGAGDAVLAVGDWGALQPVTRFAIGRADYPDRSATLIVELPQLAAAGASLTGPGIATEARLSFLTGPGIATEARLSLPELAAFQANRALFPLGFDCFLTCDSRVAGLPRSTRVMEGD